MEFSELIDEAFVFWSAVDVVVVVDFCSAPAEEILHCETRDLELLAQPRNRFVDFGDQSGMLAETLMDWRGANGLSKFLRVKIGGPGII